MPDILQQFERKTKPETAAASRVYVPFKSVDRRQIRLKIRPALQAWERVPYSYLLRIVENGEYGTQLGLVYTFLAVTITGRNLQAIADAIETENCDFIQQFNPVRFDMPTDSAAVFIENISIHVQKSGVEVLAEQKAAARVPH